jgi:hypothetical protein
MIIPRFFKDYPMKFSGRTLIVGILYITLFSAFTGAAEAAEYNERQSWMANVGIGIGRGVFNDQRSSQYVYVNGAVPQVRFGRMINRNMMININYAGWMLEFDYASLIFDIDRTVGPSYKARRSLQNVGLGLTVFPGDPLTFWGGFYMRGGAGVGWAGTTLVPVDPDTPQGHGDRNDDWGTGYFAEIGWEWWMSDHATFGIEGSVYLFDIGDELVKNAWFGAYSFTLSMYF